MRNGLNHSSSLKTFLKLLLSNYIQADNFVFDQEMLVQAIHLGFRVQEVPVPTRYFAEASSTSFCASVVYGLSILALLMRYVLHRGALVSQKQFECFTARYRRAE